MAIIVIVVVIAFVVVFRHRA